VAYPLFPLLSEKDDVVSSEGGIDPLGLYAIADALALRLIPGVRERQSRLRFLTAIAVSLELCREFDEDEVASDGITPPWQVFEWYFVEAMARTAAGADDYSIPGSLKAATALKEGVPLSAARYLKTPTVFGFHGVYRLLSRNLGIESEGQLAATGHELLVIWSKEQGLDGFSGTGGGPGVPVRKQIADALCEGMAKASTCRSAGWKGWDFFRNHLALSTAGPREQEFLTNALLDTGAGFRDEVIRFLVSKEGADLLNQDGSEKRFHQALRAHASNELRLLLDAIEAYEEFARLITDAFLDCLCEMTRKAGKTSPSVLGKLQNVQRAAERVPEIFDEVAMRLEPFGESIRFCHAFSPLSERTHAAVWIESLLEHHRKNQKQKPPAGKNSWFEKFDDGSVIIRPLYRRDKPGIGGDGYVHTYRTGSLWSFAWDLGLGRS
jgi:hypothetical protein